MNNKQNIKQSHITSFLEGCIHSYTQILFSKNLLTGMFLLLASFINPWIGLCGVLSVLTTQLVAMSFRLNALNVRDGLYGFNSLFVGLAIGYTYQYSLEILIIVIAGSIMTLLLTLWFGGWLQKYSMPYLSIPFVFAFILIKLTARQLETILPADTVFSSTFTTMSLLPPKLYQWCVAQDSANAASLVWVYLKTMGSIVFQNNIFAGILVTIGVLIYSRIAFSLSVIGFVGVFYFYQLIGANTSELMTNYAGINFIFMAIALGGFFLVPSKKSYMLVLLAIPIITILILSLTELFSPLKLPVYSLPFSMGTILILFMLRNRTIQKSLIFVELQQYSPEANLYKQKVALTRYKNLLYFPIQLPFWGEWMVSQGYNGTFTHKNEYSAALDFMLLDSEMKSFSNQASVNEDFHTFDKPVLAPCSGYVTNVIDYVEDNKIGDVNVNQNWGNTLIIKHAEGLYSQLSHLKKENIKVGVGDYVVVGTQIGSSGNSGRSPEPHLHFQLQYLPYLGSVSMHYPISYFIERENGKTNFRAFEVPREGTFVSNLMVNPLLAKTFYFIPNHKLKFAFVKQNGKQEIAEWEVLTDSYNNLYMKCSDTNSYAYFVNDGTLFYFTDFYGDKDSLLYYFYLGFYKVIQGYYTNLEIEDEFPLSSFANKGILWLQDFIAPFYQLAKTSYKMQFENIDNEYYANEITLKTQAIVRVLKHTVSDYQFSITIKENHIESFTVNKSGNQFIEAKWEN